jgi:hypothetical protein
MKSVVTVTVFTRINSYSHAPSASLSSTQHESELLSRVPLPSFLLTTHANNGNKLTNATSSDIVWFIIIIIIIIIVIIIKSSIDRDNNYCCHYGILRSAGFAITLSYHHAGYLGLHSSHKLTSKESAFLCNKGVSVLSRHILTNHFFR